MVVTWEKKKKETETFRCFKNGKLYGADLFFSFSFFEKFRQFPIRNIYKTKINIKESSERKLTEKTFVSLAARFTDPTRGTKNFAKISVAHVFITLESWN